MEEKRSIEINVQLEFQDFWQVLFWQTIKRFWLMYLLTLVITLPVISMIFYALLTNPEKIKFSPVIILPLLPLLAVLMSQWSVYSSAKKSMASVKGKTLWIFSEDDFKVFTPVARNESDWESLEKIEEKSKAFLLYPQKNVFMLVPKRFFESEAQIQEFRELVREKLGSKAKLK